MQMLLVIPKIQKSLNVLLRQHYRVFQKQQAEFDMLLHKEYKDKYTKVNFRGKKVKVYYTLYFKTKARHDYSNYGQKMLDDSLVKEGIIDDDSDRVIVEENLQIKYDKTNQRTEIFIKEVI